MKKTISNAELLDILDQADNLHEATEMISALTVGRIEREMIIVERVGHGNN